MNLTWILNSRSSFIKNCYCMWIHIWWLMQIMQYELDIKWYNVIIYLLTIHCRKTEFQNHRSVHCTWDGALVYVENDKDFCQEKNDLFYKQSSINISTQARLQEFVTKSCSRKCFSSSPANQKPYNLKTTILMYRESFNLR